jgi:predicted lipoprotein
MNAMSQCRAMALLLLMLARPASSAMADDVGKRVLEGYIHPATADLVDTSRKLAAWLPAYCTAPDRDDLRAAIDYQFAALVSAWSRVEILRFGPLVENNRFERFFFFPDPRGVLLRQVQSLLAAADPSRIDAATLRGDSVAVQGIPALEYALYASDAAQQIAGDAAAGHYRCAYAEAIATNLATLALELQRGWAAGAPAAREFSEPAPERQVYRSPQEVATELLKALVTVLQYSRDSKLRPALGDDASTARPNRAPLWRSDLTTPALAANLRGLLALYEDSGLAAALPPEDAWIDTNIRAEIRSAIAALEGVTPPFAQAVTGGDARARLAQTTLVLQNLQSIIVEYLAPALAVNLGFNSLDGD